MEPMTDPNSLLAKALWKIYNRPERPAAWTQGGNLPWHEPTFSERMLREHLDDSHSAASRTKVERGRQIEWLVQKLDLAGGIHLLDVTCGPGLYAVPFAQQGCEVTGLDFSPAAIAHARALAATGGVTATCTFIEQDVRQMASYDSVFDAAIFLYGQLTVFPKDEVRQLLKQIAKALKPGGRLGIELLNLDRVDKTDSTWWFTDTTGLWGDRPFLHLGERFWDAEAQMSLERFQIIHLETGELTEIHLCDQLYSVETMTAMLYEAGFKTVDTYPAWDGLSFYDADEWVVYIAGR